MHFELWKDWHQPSRTKSTLKCLKARHPGFPICAYKAIQPSGSFATELEFEAFSTIITGAGLTCSRELERCDRQVHSSRRASVRHSTEHAIHIRLPHPSGIRSLYNTSAPSSTISALRTARFVEQLGVLGPKIASLDGREFAPMWFRLALANQLQGSAPKPQVPAPSYLGTGPGSPRLRKTPADNLVKLEKATIPCEALPNSHQKQQRTLRRFHEREP